MKEPKKEDPVLTPLPHSVPYERSVMSSMLQEPDTFLRLANNENLTPEDFYMPSHTALYAFIMRMHAEHQPIELVSLVQRLLDNGLLDRCGGPATVMELYTYAINHNHFGLHLQGVKDKAVMREIIKVSNAQIAAAYDAPEEVKELVEQIEFNAAQIRRKTESRASSYARYRNQIASPEEMEDAVRGCLNGEMVFGGDPFFLPDFELSFRKSEFTCWLGASFHGKSSAVENQVANLAVRGRKSIIASMEQPSEVTFSKILKAMTAWPQAGKSEEFRQAYKYLSSKVAMYKDRSRAKPKNLLETFRQAYLNDGTDTMVIDNLFCLDVDRGDNSALSDAIHQIRQFVAEYPIHLHLVVHPRKVADENVGKPPTQNSIRGPAEVGDAPDNVIVVWRDLAKNEKLAEMKDNNATDPEMHRFWASTPCTKILVRKQRNGGKTPMTQCWFDPETNRFMQRPGRPSAMYDHPAPWEEATSTKEAI